MARAVGPLSTPLRAEEFTSRLVLPRSRVPAQHAPSASLINSDGSTLTKARRASLCLDINVVQCFSVVLNVIEVVEDQMDRR